MFVPDKVQLVNAPFERCFMHRPERQTAVSAEKAGPLMETTDYPGPFPDRVQGRSKVSLGEAFGLTNLGVNLTRLKPGAQSALRHFHTAQDEFIFVLEGDAVLLTDAGETAMTAGMCAGFKAGTGNGHRLINETQEEVIYLEVGDRTPGDEGSYPDDDLKALMVDGKWKFVHKDGSLY